MSVPFKHVFRIEVAQTVKSGAGTDTRGPPVWEFHTPAIEQGPIQNLHAIQMRTE